MVRTTKTDAPAKNAPTKTAPATASKKAAPKKAAPKKAAAPAPVVAAPVAPAPVANESVVETNCIHQKINEFGAKLQQISSIFSSMKGDFKTLEKVVSRELKVLEKLAAKKAKRASDRAPSGFVKPTRISDELANFLGREIGTEMARTAVSKEINAYIRLHNLQRPDNGRFIVPDEKLTTLLKISKEDELSYFNLQRYMKHHFIKANPVATA